MNKNVEFEDRIMLTESEYNLILNDLNNINVLEITNTYFDNKDLYLTSSHQVLRIRSINNTAFELTLKINRGEYCDEYNHDINKKQSEDLINHLIVPNNEINTLILQTGLSVNSLIKVGFIKVNRIEIKYDDYLFVLDKNEYVGLTDYNLEIESSSFDLAHSKMMEYVNKYHLTYSAKYISKSKRAITTYMNNLY